MSELNAVLLSIIEEAGINILTLSEGLEEDEFLSSRLTRAEVERQLGEMSGIVLEVSTRTRALMDELDWGGWEAVSRQSGWKSPEGEEVLWFAVRSLVPATLMWLRVYRKEYL